MYSLEGMKRCPVDNSFKLIGKRFTIYIIRNMMSNQNRFNQFIESIKGISPDIFCNIAIRKEEYKIKKSSRREIRI
jgi:DNA-binding HxlR family transcriptional regulator